MGVKRGYHMHYKAEGQRHAQSARARHRQRLRAGRHDQGHPSHHRRGVRASAMRRRRRCNSIRSSRPRAIYSRSTSASRTTPWMGRRPCLPDMLPAIGPVPGKPGLWADFGHHHLGFTHGARHRPPAGRDDDRRNAVHRPDAVSARAVCMTGNLRAAAEAPHFGAHRMGALAERCRKGSVMSIRRFAVLLALWSGVNGQATAQQPSGAAPKPAPSMERLSGVWIEGPGFDIGYGGTYDACAAKCLATARCVMIEYYRPEKKCNMYDAVRPRLKGGSSDVALKK